MKSPAAPRFSRQKCFDVQFDNVPGLIWYPYVGPKFGNTSKRVMVFAHNIPIPPAEYEVKLQEWKARETWAESETIEEYTYCRGWWSKAFRSFVKGAVGLTENYDEHSGPEITGKIDAFISGISYINFIQGLVSSDRQIALAEKEQIELSKRINCELLKILGITHCICWGKPVYEYIRSMTGFRVLVENGLEKSGFSSCIIDVGENEKMQCLRVHHPSMPGFGSLSKTTHSIISRFLETQL